MEGSPERIPASKTGLIIAAISLALMTTLAGHEARAEDPTIKDKARDCRIQATIAATECPADEPIPYKKCFDSIRQKVFQECMGVEPGPKDPSTNSN